jgi:hypothetical protein
VFSARSFLDGKQHVVIQRQGSAQASDAIYLMKRLIGCRVWLVPVRLP